jgi:Bacteriophage tail sheath protein
VRGVGGRDGGDVTDSDLVGSDSLKQGLYALNGSPLLNLLCIPPPIRATPENLGAVGTFTSSEVCAAGLALCVSRRAILIVDPDPHWAAARSEAVSRATAGRDLLPLGGADARNGALYFPAALAADPLKDNEVCPFAPCGAVAGVMTRMDIKSGVWKAPAGSDAVLVGVQGLQVDLSDLENAQLNRLGINCLRTVPPSGAVVWGARTLRGADQASDEYKYVSIRRLARYIEESVYRGTQWAVFEPNAEPLWGQIQAAVGIFFAPSQTPNP